MHVSRGIPLVDKARLSPLLAGVVLLAGCGDQGSEPVSEQDPAPEPVTTVTTDAPTMEAAVEKAAEAASMAADAVKSEVGKLVNVDHARDEAEFQLKRSIAGTEELLADLEAAGAAGVEETRQRLEALKAELAQLLGE